MTLLIALAVAGLVRSAGTQGPATDGERALNVAASLRCPTCQGLSVADSNSPLAKSMRDIIDEQVAAGESSEQIKAYFVERYGDWVLLAPRAEGGGLVLWAIPGGAVLVGLLVVSSLVRRRQDPGTDAAADLEAGGPRAARGSGRGSDALRWVAVGSVLAASLGVLIATNLDVREEGELATGNVTPLGSDAAQQQAPPESGGGQPQDQGVESAIAAMEELQTAVEENPDDVASRLALASAAFQGGRLDVTRTQAEAVLDRDPREVDALMLRGLAAESRKDTEATSALRSFLRLAPQDHPAVPLVRELLGEGS